MAKNFLQGKGTVVAVTAPSGGVSGGKLVMIRSLYGVAMHDAISGARCEIECPAGPVFELPTITNAAMNVGDRIFWDSTNKLANVTSAGEHCIGVALPLDTLADEAKATAGTTVRVLMGAQTAQGS